MNKQIPIGHKANHEKKPQSLRLLPTKKIFSLSLYQKARRKKKIDHLFQCFHQHSQLISKQSDARSNFKENEQDLQIAYKLQLENDMKSASAAEKFSLAGNGGTLSAEDEPLLRAEIYGSLRVWVKEISLDCLGVLSGERKERSCFNTSSRRLLYYFRFF